MWKCEINVGEYKTLNLVKVNTKKKNVIFPFCSVIEMQEKGHNVLFQPWRNLDFSH